MANKIPNNLRIPADVREGIQSFSFGPESKLCDFGASGPVFNHYSQLIRKKEFAKAKAFLGRLRQELELELESQTA